MEQRTVAHMDLDSFFVSVEWLKNPRLKGLALAVGGSSNRGVVAACSYEARRFGVHSAMPMKIAKRLCPHMLVISGDMESYSQYSRLVTEIIADKVPLYEKRSIDEFYIDLTGMDKYFGCRTYTAELKEYITKHSGLPISYGIASNKLVCKVATNEGKPNGQMIIPFGQEKPFLNPLNIEKLPMVGKQTSMLLRRMGVEKIKTLSEIPVEYMENMFGKHGIELSRRANGIDESPVIPYQEQKSIGTENTFPSDTIDIEFMHSELTRMTERIAFELRKSHHLTGCITLKIRYSDFNTLTKQCRIPYTASDHIIVKKVRELFTTLYDRRVLVRLIGVRFTELIAGTHQINLFDDTEEMIHLYSAIDSIKDQYGKDLITRAISLLKLKPCF